MDYTHLLHDPNFKNFLENVGYKKDETLPEKESYTVIFGDGIQREASWGFTHFFCLTKLMDLSNIKSLDPMNNWMHFALILYATMLPEMFDAESNIPNEKHLTFDAFVELLPIDEQKLGKLITIMTNLLSKNKELIVK